MNKYSSNNISSILNIIANFIRKVLFFDYNKISNVCLIGS